MTYIFKKNTTTPKELFVNLFLKLTMLQNPKSNIQIYIVVEEIWVPLKYKRFKF